MNDNRNEATDGEAKAKPEVIKLGLDLHARQVTECRQLDGSTPKPPQRWESYLRGNRDAMSIVAVPSPEQEQRRSLVRYREQLVRNRRRAEARGRALALTQGILAPVGWWRPAAWKQFKTQLPEWMDCQLEHWQEQALAIDAKERQVRRELEKMVGIELPIGVGVLSWITLELEIRGWERFGESSADCQLHWAVPGHPQQQWSGPRRPH